MCLIETGVEAGGHDEIVTGNEEGDSVQGSQGRYKHRIDSGVTRPSMVQISLSRYKFLRVIVRSSHMMCTNYTVA